MVKEILITLTAMLEQGGEVAVKALGLYLGLDTLKHIISIAGLIIITQTVAHCISKFGNKT